MQRQAYILSDVAMKLESQSMQWIIRGQSKLGQERVRECLLTARRFFSSRLSLRSSAFSIIRMVCSILRSSLDMVVLAAEPTSI